ncbi:DNA polymerase III subunit delta [Chloroflexota bacterium]
MLYVLSGQDDYSLGESLEEIKRDLGNQPFLEANTTALDGLQVSLEQLRAACDTLPFLTERRLVIVNGLLERFEPRGKSSRRRQTARATNHQHEYQSLGDYICRLPDSTILVLIDSGITSKNPLSKEISAKAVVKHYPLLRGTRLCQWIRKYVIKEGGTISPQAVDLLAKLVGSNLWIMANEINKLVLFTLGRSIEEGDVETVVSYTRQASVFVMVDAILELKVGLAERLLHQLLQGGAGPAYLLVMLSRQIRMIVRVRELRNQGEPEKWIWNKLGMTSEYAWHKTIEQVERYPLERIKEVYHKLLETDLSIKTGKYEDELALNILIAELCRRGKM